MDFIINALHSIGFNWHVALANFINFLVVLFVLNKFVFKKVLSTLEEREQIIKKGLTDASEAEKRLGEASSISASMLNESNIKADRILEDTISKANQEAAKIKENAKNEIDSLRAELIDKSNTVSERLENDFMKNAPELARALLAKILNESLDEDMNNKISLALTK